jgi:predicted CXXCH cytochrome family protein
MQSPMHNMTRLATEARIAAPFDGRAFPFQEDSARLLTSGTSRFVAIESARYGKKTYKVTKVIGGHYREDFVGVEVATASPDAAPADGASAEEVVLPVSFVLGTQSFRYKGYSVMVKERDGLRAGPVWKKTCIFCHNTVPYFSIALGALAGSEARAYQGEIVDTLLPPYRRVHFEVTDESAVRAALTTEIGRLHSRDGEEDSSLSFSQTAVKAVNATRANFDTKHLLEVGIGCESCHGGSREHVQDARIKPSFSPRAPGLRVAGTQTRTQQINRTCARCHQVLFSQYPFTWEGGARAAGPAGAAGGSNINSGEGRDFLLGGCATEMSCATCHDPHARDGRARMTELETTPAGDAICTSCHKQFRGAEAVRAHAKHDPSREGARCISCHMPKKNMSLDSRLTRYHRISSPTDPARVEADRPIECALCHADKSVATILSDMKRLWNKSYDETKMRALYGDLDENALVATLRAGKPHEQAVALYGLGEARMRSAAPLIKAQLAHPYPIVRPYAEAALAKVEGRP